MNNSVKQLLCDKTMPETICNVVWAFRSLAYMMYAQQKERKIGQPI